VISETFLLSHLDRLGLIDLQPLRKRILDREFDIVVTPAKAASFRGIAHMPAGLRTAIAQEYQPFCLFEGWLLHLPRQSPRFGLAQRFTAIGCIPTVPGVTGTAW
jgi:hypothetical protein